MTKILVISHSSVVGSYQSKLHRLAGYPGIQVMLLIPPQWKEGGRVVKAETQRYQNIKTISLPVFFGEVASIHFYNPFLLKKIVKSFAPDIVYVEEEPWSFAALQLLLLSRRNNMKFIFFTWENLWRQYNMISERVLSYVLRYANGAVAGNEEAKEILRKRGFSRPVSVFPQYGIDPEVFQQRQNIPHEISALQKPLVAYVGRLVHEKNIDILLHAVARIHKEIQLLIIGDGPEKGHLIALTHRLAIQARVKFINAVPYDDVPRYLNALDIVVLSSMTTPGWKEQFGRILVEAMACGVAVIGSDSGSIPWVIGDAGLIFKEGEVESLVIQLETLLHNDDQRKALGEKGRKRAQQCFTNAVIAKELLDFVTLILHEKPSSIK